MRKSDELRNKEDCFRLSNRVKVHSRKSWISSTLMTLRIKARSHRELFFQEVHREKLDRGQLFIIVNIT